MTENIPANVKKMELAIQSMEETINQNKKVVQDMKIFKKLYYELKIKYEAWQEWYKEQKSIADELKK